MEKIIHHGQNIRRFREMFNIKQEGLASLMGDDWTQKKISLLEGKEEIEPEILQQVATALKVSPEAIKGFSEDLAINIISNTFNNHDHSSPQFANTINYSPTFNPIDKIVELLEKMVADRDKTIEELKHKLK